jgi:hypothetical protein
LNSSVRRPEDAFELWVASDAAISIVGGFAAPEVDHLVNLILNAQDPAMKKVLFHRFDKLIADLQLGSFLFRKMPIDVISKRFELKYPFSFDYEGFYRMQFARLKNER